MDESMFQNMPEFENVNSQVFGFNITGEFQDKIERKMSGVGHTLLSHRET